MKRITKILKNKNGQAMVLMIIFAIILVGFAALVLDVGVMAYTKSKMQNIADTSALSGAQMLPVVKDAKNTARKIVELNGFVKSGDIFKVTTPYEGDSRQIEIMCKRTVEYSFAKILGFNEKEIVVRAVAQQKSQWDGDVLPFINLDDDYTMDSEIEAWEKLEPGDKESIYDYEIINPKEPDKLYFKVDYLKGIKIKKGTVATIKQEVGHVYDRQNSVYIVSLSNTVMDNGSVKLTDGNYRELSKLKNKDVIDLSQLVLLRCIFHDYDYKGKTLFLTVEQVYDIANNEFPSDYVGIDSKHSKLIK